MATTLPMQGLRVVERADGVAAAFAGRLLALLGAETVMAEPPAGSALRRTAPFLPGGRASALFAYYAAGKRSVVCAGEAELDALLADAMILFDDTPVAERPALGLAPQRVAVRHPALVHVSVLPFGATGPKAGWKGEEMNLIHASGEGILLPNGLSAELFPDRPPLKIYGHFAECQGGVAAALAAIAALWMEKGQFVDVSVQDAALSVSAFAVQRFGDGAVEHRHTRSFRYGGVMECADGYVEILTLEDRQWHALVALMGQPSWAEEPAFADPLDRGRRGAEINQHVRDWARLRLTEEVVAFGQALGVPVAKYKEPSDILLGAQERARGLFAPISIPDFGEAEILAAPFRFGPEPLLPQAGPPELGADQFLLDSALEVRG